MVDNRRRQLLAHIGTMTFIAGCSTKASTSTPSTTDTTVVKTQEMPTFQEEDLSLRHTKDTPLVDSIGEATILLISSTTEIDEEELVSSLCDGALLIIVGSNAGMKLKEILKRGKASQCYSYGMETSENSIVAAAEPRENTLNTHSYGSVSDSNEEYKYNAVNEIINSYPPSTS